LPGRGGDIEKGNASCFEANNSIYAIVMGGRRLTLCIGVVSRKNGRDFIVQGSANTRKRNE
jgi:hypothetical protein